jgi:hypothetical protein
MTSVELTVLYKAYFHSPIVSLIYGTAKSLSDQGRTVVPKILISGTVGSGARHGRRWSASWSPSLPDHQSVEGIGEK